MRLVVVSWPPTMVTMQLAITSSSVNRSPSTSASSSAPTQPRRGRVPLLADGRPEVVGHVLALRSTRGTRSGLCWKLPSISAKSADHALSCR